MVPELNYVCALWVYFSPEWTIAMVPLEIRLTQTMFMLSVDTHWHKTNMIQPPHMISIQQISLTSVFVFIRTRSQRIQAKGKRAD